MLVEHAGEHRGEDTGPLPAGGWQQLPSVVPYLCQPRFYLLLSCVNLHGPLNSYLWVLRRVQCSQKCFYFGGLYFFWNRFFTFYILYSFLIIFFSSTIIIVVFLLLHSFAWMCFPSSPLQVAQFVVVALSRPPLHAGFVRAISP